MIPTTLDLGALGFDRGAHILLRRALADAPSEGALNIRGTDPALAVHLPAWARKHGHAVTRTADGWRLAPGPYERQRWGSAERAGRVDQPKRRADPRWGLAARGAAVEQGGPPLDVEPDLAARDTVWTDLAPRLYAQAAASQWDPATAVDWRAGAGADADADADGRGLPVAVEDAVVQVMTYLIENEQAALVIPARFAARVHPHYREVVQFLAVQAADEARHVEVFTRRAALHRPGGELGTSGAGGRASLQTLVAEQDFSLASFLLSVLGEGSFLNLLSFIEEHGPDPVTRQVARLALQDEARHVAFGLGHLEHRVAREPQLKDRLRQAVERRHRALQDMAGLNEDVFDALVVLAAGSWEPAAIESGFRRVERLEREMDEGRRRRLARLGFSSEEAAELSSLHTRNFM